MKHPGKIEADPLLRQLIGGFSINGGVRAGTVLMIGDRPFALAQLDTSREALRQA